MDDVFRRRLLGRTGQAIALVVTLLTGVAVAGVRVLGPSDPVTVDEAVSRFRAGRPEPTPPAESRPPSPAATVPASASASAVPTSAATPASATTAASTATRRSPATRRDPRPAEGVYVYATTGYESVDAMSGSRHDYPAETTMTVRHTDCGLVGRWDASEDRWDETHECVSDESSVLTRYVTYHRFLGQDERKELVCGPRAYLRPPSTKPGFTWTFTCSGSGTTARTTGEVVAVETVAGERALHFRAITALSGSSRGEERRDYWLSLVAPGVLRAAVLVDADEDTPFGTVHYHEEYELRLISRTPRR